MKNNAKISKVIETKSAEYYDPKPLFDTKCTFKIAVGIKSNGKTYAFLKRIIETYLRTGKVGVYVRRLDLQIRGEKGSLTFANHVANGEITRLTGGEWDGVEYFRRAWYFTRTDENGDKTRSEEPFCYARAIATQANYNSVPIANPGVVFLDEFIVPSESGYLEDEFTKFQVLLSDIIRNREGVEVLMAGNTVNDFCPYISEMGLWHFPEQKKGTIEIYNYDNPKLSVAIEYVPKHKRAAINDYYFSFDNPDLSLITEGDRMYGIYPTTTEEWEKEDIDFTYFIIFDRYILQCEIIQVDDKVFTYVHYKTTPLKNPDEDIVFCLDNSPKPNYRKNLMKPIDSLGQKIKWFYDTGKVFYQCNSVGNKVMNYITECTK